MARDHGRRVPEASASEPHLLNKKFQEYPLEGTDVIKKLGPIELMRAASVVPEAAVFHKKGNEQNLEEWVVNRFGWRLYSLFFQSYTEKVWGVPCNQIGGRLGRAAHQGPLVHERREGRVLRRQGRQAQVAHQGVQLPAFRPRPDVGDDDRPHQRARVAASRWESRITTASPSRTARVQSVQVNVLGGHRRAVRHLVAPAPQHRRSRRRRRAG